MRNEQRWYRDGMQIKTTSQADGRIEYPPLRHGEHYHRTRSEETPKPHRLSLVDLLILGAVGGTLGALVAAWATAPW